MISQNMEWLHVPAAIVAHGGADVFGNGVRLLDQFFRDLSPAGVPSMAALRLLT